MLFGERIVGTTLQNVDAIDMSISESKALYEFRSSSINSELPELVPAKLRHHVNTLEELS